MSLQQQMQVLQQRQLQQQQQLLQLQQFEHKLQGVQTMALSALNITWEERAAYMKETFGSSSQAKEIADAMPRFSGPSKFEANTDYAIGTAMLAAPGLVLAVLTAFSCFLFCCCRWCCRRCWADNIKTEGYTPRERYLPLAIALIFAVAACALSGVGLRYNNQLSDGVQNEDNGSTQIVVATLTYAEALTDYIRILMQSVAMLIPPITSQVEGVLNSGMSLGSGSASVIDQLDDLVGYMGGLQLTVQGDGPIGDQTFTCDYCQDTAQRVDVINQDVRATADDAIEQLNATVADVRANLLDVTADILSVLSDAVNQVGDVQVEVRNAQSDVDSVVSDVEKYDDMRRKICIAFLSLSFASCALLILGAVFKVPLLLNCNVAFGGLTLFVMWLLFAIHLPVATMTADGCVYLDEHEPALEAHFDADVAAVVYSCLMNTSMLQALGIEDELDFANIQFPTIPNVNETFDFGELQTFRSEVDALSLATFPEFADERTTILADLNGLTFPDVFHDGNISTCVPADYPNENAVQGFKSAYIVNRRAYNQLTDELSTMRGRVGGVLTTADALKTNTQQFQDNLNGIHEVVDPVFALAQEGKDAANCGLVGYGYYGMKQAFCHTMIESLGFMTLAFFLIPVFMTPVTLLSITLAKRLPRPAGFGPYYPESGRVSAEETDNTLEDVEMNNYATPAPYAVPNDAVFVPVEKESRFNDQDS